VKWARYRDHDQGSGLGVVSEELIFQLNGLADLISLLGDDGTRLREAGRDALRSPARVIELASAQLLAPLDPPTVRDFYAFEQHPLRNSGQGAHE